MTSQAPAMIDPVIPPIPDAHAAVFDHIDRHAAEYIEEVRQFLRIPGFSDTGEGIRESAEACLGYLQMIGATDAQLVETAGHPVVYGKILSKDPNAKTLMIYSLYDTTPIGPSAWTFDPLGANIVDASEIGMPSSLGSVICNRGAINHRGPIMSTILGIRVMQELLGDIPVNLVWCWDGEEEIGSPNLPVFLERYRDEIRQCEGMWGPSMRQDENLGDMVIPLDYKGGLAFQLECKGGEWGGTIDARHTHSANAPLVDAPMLQLIHAVGSIFDDDHNVIIDGLAETVVPRTAKDTAELEATKAAYDGNEAQEEYWKAVIGNRKFRGGRPLADLIERLLFDGVQGNVQAFHGGYTGPLFFNMLPQTAVAKLNMYLPPGGPSPEKLLELLRAHLDRRGFDHVEIQNARGMDSIKTPADNPLVTAGIRAAAMHGVATTIVPRINGYNPAALIDRAGDGVPAVWVGLGHGERPHQADEYIVARGIPSMMKYAITFLHEWAKEPRTKNVQTTS